MGDGEGCAVLIQEAQPSADNQESPTWRHLGIPDSGQGILRSADHVFFRIGLARGWSRYPDRCYLQITGVYTFPDYLDGKCFADFA
ncbi:MAG: hypothetical protein ACOX4K_06115 [Bacillota bacterium]|jgi:hypothetical protein